MHASLHAYFGAGPPPTYPEDVEASIAVYNPNTQAGRRLKAPLPQEDWHPLAKNYRGWTPDHRAVALVSDNLYRNGGVARLEDGAFDTERVAFYVTFNPFGPRRSEKKYPSPFHFTALNHSYPIGQSSHWSTARRSILVAVRGTANKADFDLDYEAGLEMLSKQTSLTVRESAIYRSIDTAVRDAQLRYPKNTNDYYATGHSLGGALADELVRSGLVLGSVDFNPLVSAFDTSGGTADPQRIQRLYMYTDPVRDALELTVPSEVLDKFNSTTTFHNPLDGNNPLAAHLLHNFQAHLGNVLHLLRPPAGHRL